METARRAQIMAAAIDTIAAAGFAGASFAHIAGKLGISRGLISYHFAGKDDLVKEVIHQAAEQAKALIGLADQCRVRGPGGDDPPASAAIRDDPQPGYDLAGDRWSIRQVRTCRWRCRPV